MQSHPLINNLSPGIYGITDNRLMPCDKQLLKQAESALQAGMRVLQYRNKNPASPEEPLRQVKKLLILCNDYNVPLMINDNVELAYTTGAHGVHLGAEDLSPVQARNILGPDAIIGVTCNHFVHKAVLAEQQGANYVAFGRFFPSKTKPEAEHADLSILKEAKKQCTLPIVAIGGITPDNCAEVVKAGADIIAVIHSLFASGDINQQIKRFNQCMAYNR